MKIDLPELALVLLVGPSGSGKSTFAQKHFGATEVVSSDALRGMVADDPADQSASEDAFHLLHEVVEMRLARGRFTVVDATHVEKAARDPLMRLARRHHVPRIALVFDLPRALCHAHNRGRPGRQVPADVLDRQYGHLSAQKSALASEGLDQVFRLDSRQALDTAVVERLPMPFDRRHDRGPFDVIGDVHGCREELVTLLLALGFAPGPAGYRHPEGRRAVFVGDLVDRGPDSPGVLDLVMRMVAAKSALCVAGNHDDKLLRKLQGHAVRVGHGLERTLAQLEGRSDSYLARLVAFIEGLPSHLLLDGGDLVVAHAGLTEALHGRASKRVRAFCLYGETTGEVDALGLPVRLDWAQDYRGRATVVYGHTPIPDPAWVHNTLCIDTGCVFGGRLTALRYPEKQLVSVPAARVHYHAPATPAGGYLG